MSEQEESSAGAAKPAPLDMNLAYGEAAFVLLDSLILTMAHRGVLNHEDLGAVIENAIATKRQMVEDGEHPKISKPAAGLLSVMANSLAATRPGEAVRNRSLGDPTALDGADY